MRSTFLSKQLKNKKVDFEYIENQRRRLDECLLEFNKNQIHRIQNAETKVRLSILFYSFLENCEKISKQTQNLLDIFREYFGPEIESPSFCKLDRDND